MIKLKDQVLFFGLCFITGVAAGAFCKITSGGRSDELMAIISGFCTGISDRGNQGVK